MILYEIRVASIILGQERVFLRASGINEEVLLKILELYGNENNKIEVWEIRNDSANS